MEVQEKYHQCSFCDFKSTVAAKLQQHIRLHTREKPFICDQCKRGYSSKNCLNQHKLRVHEGVKTVYEKKFKCFLCPFATHYKGNWEKHTKSHLGERSIPFKHPGSQCAAETPQALSLHSARRLKLDHKILCPFPNCEYRGKTRTHLKQHSVTHSEHKPFVCDFEGCNYRAKRKQALVEHQRGVHNNGYKPFSCSLCNYCTTAKWRLSDHELTHSEKKSFNCGFPECGFSCKSKRNLTVHVRNRHCDKIFKCDIKGCVSTAANLFQLKEHKKRVHNEKVYNCPHCDYRAAFPSIIKNHILVRHKDSHRVQCPTKGCTFQTKNVESLNKHLRQHAISLGCPLEGCGYVSHSSSSLKRHMQLHDPACRPYRCPLCPKCFATNGNLSQHLQTHTLEKPFQCPCCEYGSVVQTNILRHMRVFHPTVLSKFDKESVCNHCNVNFGSAYGLAMHRMKLKTAVVVLTRLQLKL